MDTTRIYGYKHLGVFFQEILGVEEDGFVYRGKKYRWSDIIRIERFESKFYSHFMPLYFPSAYIYLKDGEKIKLMASRLIEKERKSTVKFLGGPTKTYKDLLAFIDKKVKIIIERF